MKCPSLAHVISVSFKSTLPEIRIATPDFFLKSNGLVNILQAFHAKPVFISVHEIGLCKQLIVGSSFLIHFAKWCLLMGELSHLIVSVNIDSHVVIPDI
jgi:hypothetical protein